MTDTNIDTIISKFKLIPHPEGGYYSETYRSEIELPSKDRQIATTIYFLLRSGEVSKFHRIKSDELWFFHQGSPLIVHTLDCSGHKEFILGNNIKNGEAPQYLVKGNTIFGSSVLNDNSFSLVSCVCAPGFDFRDFELFSSEDLIAQFPLHQEIIKQLT